MPRPAPAAATPLPHHHGQGHIRAETNGDARLRTLAALDIGTNSIRLEVVRVNDDHSLTTLTQQKESVRLGEQEFTHSGHSELTAAAIERGALVCARFADVARGFQADEIIALATSAVREADNREEFIDRVREEARIDARVISGPEEARLIYLGVSSGADLGDRTALFVDIGGGSTELILGDARGYTMLDSLKLGSIRLSNRFLLGERGPITPEQFGRIKEFARATAGHAVRRLKASGFDAVYGSAGTITNLADVTARRLGDSPTSLRNYTVRTSDLRDTIDILCRLPLEERRRVPGLDPDRADIILGGAAALMMVLEDVRADRITISDRGLRHGIIVDRLMREAGAGADLQTPVRLRSVLQLARSCNFDEEHARHIAHLSLSLFDELGRLGMHRLGERERELLEYAAYVHDIGCFLSHSNHQRHAYYLVRHSDLLGFNDTEIAIIASVALYHRKASPRSTHENMRPLTKQARRAVAMLAGILRVAEGLDRSHLALVRGIRLERLRKPDRIVCTLDSSADCQLELWGVRTNQELFELVFGAYLLLKVEDLGGESAEAPPPALTSALAARPND